MASVIGQKLSYLNIGDVLIQVFRWDSDLKCVRRIFESNTQRVGVSCASGEDRILTPKLIELYTPEYRTHENITKIVGQADYGVVKVRPRDVVIICSDGVHDNVSIGFVKATLEAAYNSDAFEPNVVAHKLVEEAQQIYVSRHL